jgi:hypothetical protein
MELGRLFYVWAALTPEKEPPVYIEDFYDRELKSAPLCMINAAFMVSNLLSRML